MDVSGASLIGAGISQASGERGAPSQLEHACLSFVSSGECNSHSVGFADPDSGHVAMDSFRMMTRRLDKSS